MSKKERIENLEDHIIQLREELDETRYAVKLLAIALGIVDDIKEDKKESFSFIKFCGNNVDLGFLNIYLKNKENEGV